MLNEKPMKLKLQIITCKVRKKFTTFSLCFFQFTFQTFQFNDSSRKAKILNAIFSLSGLKKWFDLPQFPL